MERRSTELLRAAGARRWLACGLLGMQFGAWAGPIETVPVLSNPIPPQPLAAALAEFARQTRLQVVYVSTTVRSRVSKGAPAGIAPVDALARLLDGTGLSFEFLNPRTVRIFETETAAPTAQARAVEAPKKRIEGLSESVSQIRDGGALEDVIITAQRRSESIGSVPMSISAISAVDLAHEHITNIPDLSRSVPNVSFTTLGGPGLSTFEIRGVSSLAGTAAIGVYQNDVSLTTRKQISQGTAEPRFFDLDRVEVLRGPQGTLYGGGTLGGVIRFIEKQPNLSELDASASLDVSDTRHGGTNYNTEGVLNLPLAEGKLALRLGAQQGHDSGYIDQVSPTDLNVVAKGINGNRWSVAKAVLKWQITDAWSATPAIFYQKFESDDIDTFFATTLSNQPVPGATLQPLQTSKTVREPGTDRLTISSLTVGGDVGYADLIIVSSLYQRNFVRFQDGTLANVHPLADRFPQGSALANGIAALNSVIDYKTQQSQQSLEARLASKPYSPGGGLPISWVAGAIYLSSTTEGYDNEPIIGITKLFNQFGLNINDPNVFPNSFPGAWAGGDSSYYEHLYDHPSQRAVFGELNYYFRRDMHVTLGLRYESAKDTFERDANYFYVFCGVADALGNTAGCPLRFSPPDAHFSATTPRAAVTWDLSPSKLIYASASKGYREGSFNRPVTIRGIEIYDLTNLGLCNGTPAGCAGVAPNSFKPDSLWSYELGGKSRFFDNRLSVDASVYLLKWNDTQQVIVLAISEQDFVENVGHVESYGAELEVKARPIRNLNVSLAGGYNHATFADDVPALGSNNGTLNVTKGGKVPGVPDYDALLGAEYTFPCSGRAEGFARGVVRVVGRSRGTFAIGDPDYDRPGYVTSDASTGLTFGAFEISMFVKNLNNAQSVFQRPTLNYATEAYTMRPRTIGLAVDYHFAH